MPTKPVWKIELEQLHLEYIRNTAPGFFKASGGDKMKIKPYSDTNTNGLTRCVLEFLKFKGHYAIRTNRQGQARIERIPRGGTQTSTEGKGYKTYGKLSFTKNPEEKHFSDIQASISGLYVAIEVKCKATRDRFDKDGRQLDNANKVVASGGVFVVADTMENFHNWYYDFIKKHEKK